MESIAMVEKCLLISISIAHALLWKKYRRLLIVAGDIESEKRRIEIFLEEIRPLIDEKKKEAYERLLAKMIEMKIGYD